MRSHLPLPHDGLGPGVPVPEEHRAVLAAADDVAVGGVVALRASEAGNHAVVTKDDLTDLRSFSRKHPETVVVINYIDIYGNLNLVRNI